MRKRSVVAALGAVVAATAIVIGLPEVASANSSAPPTVSVVSPANGPLSGGTFVTITGGHFDGATAVDFGSTPAPSGWFVKSPGIIDAIAPSSATTGPVVVTVTTPNGTSSSTASGGNQFDYVTGPTIQSVTPGTGPTIGGSSVTISGQDFACPCGVTFGGVAANSVTDDSTTELTATAPGPESAGTVPVVVTTTDGTTPVDPAATFTYASDNPIVIFVSPSSGTQGTQITITGEKFKRTPKGSTQVFFGTTPATGVVVHSGKTVTAVAPAGTGTVDVTVSDPEGTSPVSEPGDEFTYTS
jgi:hypothetical protein